MFLNENIRKINKWSKNFDERPHRRGIFHCENLIWYSTASWFLGPTRVKMPNGITIGSAALAGLTVMSDRPTDRPRYSVCGNMPHLASASVRPTNVKT